MDSKSIGLCPKGFESPRCRLVFSGDMQPPHPAIMYVYICTNINMYVYTTPSNSPCRPQSAMHIHEPAFLYNLFKRFSQAWVVMLGGVGSGCHMLDRYPWHIHPGAIANKQSVAWSSGMILAQGARGPGFNSRSSPFGKSRHSIDAVIPMDRMKVTI